MLQEKGDRGLNITINVLLVLAAIICMYPIWYVIICSVSSPSAIAQNKVILWPVGFTTAGYEMMFQDNTVWIGYRNSIIYTTLATILALVVQLSAGYALSRRIPGRRWLSTFFVLTMYFSGGVVPAYLLINEIGWIDNPIVMIVPGAMSAYNMIVARSFFIGSIPESLFDDMTCNSFDEIDDPARVEEILTYDWIMVTFEDASKSIYFISPEEKIYWGTSFTVECPSLLQWYKENKAVAVE